MRNLLLILGILFIFGMSSKAIYKWTNYDTISGLYNLNIKTITTDINGNIWVGFSTQTEGVIARFDGTTWSEFIMLSGYTDVSDISFDGIGNVWIACFGGLAKFNGSAWNYWNDQNGLEDIWLQTINVDPNGVVWCGTENNATRFESGGWDFFHATEGMICDNSTGIDFDESGGIWIGSKYFPTMGCNGGMSHFNGVSWQWYTSASTNGGMINDDVSSVFVDSQGSIWVGTSAGLSRLSDTVWTNWSVGSGIPANVINDIKEDADGNIWIATPNGVGKFEYGYWTIFNTTNSQLASNDVRKITIGNDRSIWFATAMGVSRMQEALEVYPYPYGDVSCGQCNGRLDISIYGGVPPYHYSWSNGFQNGSGNIPFEYDSITGLCPGVYFLTITDSAGSVEPFYDTVELNEPPSSISGNLYCAGLDCSYMEASVELYKAAQGGLPHTLIQTYDVFSYDSYFFLEGLRQGAYILKAVISPNATGFSGYMDTYYDTVYKNKDAQIINLGCAIDSGGFFIKMRQFQPSTAGTGTITGKLHYLRFSKSLKTVGEPVPGAEIYIEQEPSDEPIANTTTDTAGVYTFDQLSDGTYSIYVDIPGVDMVSTYDSITIDNGTQTQTDLDFFVDTLNGYGISTDSTLRVSEFTTSKFSINVFPNPTNELVNIDYSFEETSTVQISIIDATGRIVSSRKEQKKAAGKYSETAILPSSGIYFIRMRIDNNIYIKKLIRE